MNPYYNNHSKPSELDIKSAYLYSNSLNGYGINVVEFVCEKSVHYEYHFSASDTFLPTIDFAKRIHEKNGTSKIQNLSLHTKRIFLFINNIIY